MNPSLLSWSLPPFLLQAHPGLSQAEFASNAGALAASFELTASPTGALAALLQLLQGPPPR